MKKLDISKPCYLFFDLDGTVITHERKLPPENLDAMLRVQKLGHKLILNTGRSQAGYMRTNASAAHVIPWDGMCFSASDIFYEGRLIYECGVAWDDFSVWFEYCMDNRLDVWYCGRKEQRLFDFTRFSSPMTESEKIEWRQKAESEFKENTLTNISIMGVLDGDDLPKSGLCICQLPRYADLFPASCDKGQVVRIFCEKIGASLDQCVGFGDSNNDIDMLKTCPTAVCMKDSPQSLIDVSTYHAKTENGVAEALHKLFGV